MLTGDASVNADAPVICCTAEILANIALREGAQADVGLVVMDEFHFYAEPDRGWAWQVPLIELPKAQFVLMSATLGDVSELAEDLSRRTGRETALVDRRRAAGAADVHLGAHAARRDARGAGAAPTRRRSTSCTSPRRTPSSTRPGSSTPSSAAGRPPSWTRSRSGWPASGSARASARRCPSCCAGGSACTTPGCCRATGGWSSSSPRPGCSPSSAAPTPSASASTCRSGPCCSPVSRSTTATGSRILRIREFHQIAGRAGRAGFDTSGNVVVQAPPHTIENEKAKAKSDAKNAAMSVEKQAKRKSKPQLRKPPEGTVVWTEQTFDRLVTGVPEQLVSRMRVDNSMLINVLGREEDAFPVLRRILTDNHETERDKLRLSRRALRLARSLRAVRDAHPARRGRRVRPPLRPDRRPARGLRAQPGARALRAGRPRRARPRGGGAHARHRLGRRVGARGAAADPVRPAVRRARRGGQRDEGRRHRVRGADGAARPGHLAAAAGRAARGDVRALPPEPPVAATRTLLGAEVDRARDVRAGDELHRLRGPLPARPVRGPGAALPHRRLPDDPPDGARRRTGRRSSRTCRSGWGRRSGRPTPRCSTSGRRSPTPRRSPAGPPSWPRTSSRPRRGPSRSRTARSR